MNLAAVTFNSPREVGLRFLYLLPIPMILTAFFLPFVACTYHLWQLIGLSGVLIAATIYFRHLGVQYWEFERLDDILDGAFRVRPYSFEKRRPELTEREIDRLLLIIEDWDGQAATRPESLLAGSTRHRHDQSHQSYWDN